MFFTPKTLTVSACPVASGFWAVSSGAARPVPFRSEGAAQKPLAHKQWLMKARQASFVFESGSYVIPGHRLTD